MKFRKKFSIFVIIGIMLLLFQIVIDIRYHINCINSYDVCLLYFSEEHCQCNIFTATGSYNLMYASNFISFVHGLANFVGFNSFGIVGLLFIIFEKKNKSPINNNYPNKIENISKDEIIKPQKAEMVEIDTKKDDNKFFWE